MPASTFFSGRAHIIWPVLPIVLLIVLLGACSEAVRRIERDPYFEIFFEKTRLIMTNEEIQIYKHLPDDRTKEEFIDEFWLKRDPNPETEENETKIEFENRITYANRWFKENRSPGRGWDTPRGRILLQLGEPDNRFQSGMIRSSSINGYERWVYDNYQLSLTFVDRDGFGEFEAWDWPPELLTAIEHAKVALLQSDRDLAQKIIAFDAAFKDNEVTVSIPLKSIHFNEDRESIRTDFKVIVTAYRNYAKVAARTFNKQLSYSKDNVPVDKKIAFSLPFPLRGKGKYYLEVLVEEVLTGSRARNFVDFKL